MRTIKFFLLAMSILVTGCTNEDEEQVTTFIGVVQLPAGIETYTAVQVEIYGLARNQRCWCDDITKIDKVYAVDENGSFNIQVTTAEVDYFRLQLRLQGERVTTTIRPEQLTGYIPGKVHEGLVVSPILE